MRQCKRVLVSIAILFASIPAIAQDLTGIWRDESGTRYAVRQSGSDLCWSMEKLPAASTVFCGSIMPPLVVGTWLDLPTGQRRGAGQLVLRIDSENRIVRVNEVQGSYGAATWIREGTSGAGGGWSPGAGSGSTAGSSGGGWTASGPPGGSAVPAAGSTGAAAQERREPPPASPPPSEFTRKQGVTYAGGTPVIRFYTLRDAFPGQCEADCARDPACMAYTYIRPGGYKAGDPPVCYLFSQPGFTVNNDCCTSGERSAGAGASLAGTWLFRGIAGQNCTIAPADISRLVVVTEKGVRGDGYLSANNVLDVVYPSGRIRGQISADRNRINWSNGEFWTRAGAGATAGGGATGGAGGGTRSAGCDEIAKGPWYYTGDSSGHHIWVYPDSLPPGSWGIGGFEVDVRSPAHAGRWGPVTCLGNNRYELKTSDGKPFIVVTLRDGKLVKDDGTSYKH